MSHATFSGNRSGRLGGGMFHESSKVVLDFSDVKDNHAASGAGLASQDSDVYLYQVAIMNNRSEGEGSAGGGLYHANGALELSRTVVRGNSAQYGGGMYLYGENPTNATLIHTEMEGNKATYGGGLYGVNGQFTLWNTLVSDNVAEEVGGGLYGFQS